MTFIDEQTGRFAVALLLRVLNIVESTYCRWVNGGAAVAARQREAHDNPQASAGACLVLGRLKSPVAACTALTDRLSRRVPDAYLMALQGLEGVEPGRSDGETVPAEVGGFNDADLAIGRATVACTAERP